MYYKMVFDVFLIKVLTISLLSFLLISCGGEGGDGGGASYGPGSIVLSWKAPTTNVDRSCIEGDLAGFEIRYGFNSGVYSDSIDIPINQASCVPTSETTSCGTVQLCSYTFSDLPAATWFAAVSAYDLAGNSGPLSNETSATLF